MALSRFVQLSDRPEESPLRDGQRWGHWVFRLNNYTLVYAKRGQYEYDLDLEECTRSSEVLDWIFQLHLKPWMTNQDTRDLLEAFNAILYPQSNLCYCGTDKIINPVEVIQNRMQRSQEGK